MSMKRVPNWQYPRISIDSGESKSLTEISEWMKVHHLEHEDESVTRIQDFENLTVGVTSVGILKLTNATAPLTAPADMSQFWSQDRSAGYAQVYYRAEGGLSRSLDPFYNILDYTDLPTAITAIGATEATLLISTQIAVTDNATIPSTMTLKFLRGGSFTITTAKTVTINGQVDAGLYQIFEGAGTVAFGVGTVKYSYPEWWGAVRDGTTDDATALNSAYTAADGAKATLFLSSGTYAFESQLSWDNYPTRDGCSVEGQGRFLTTLLKNGNFVGIKIASYAATYEGFSVTGNGHPYGSRCYYTGSGADVNTGIQIYYGAQIRMKDVYVGHHGNHGILVESGNGGLFEEVFCWTNCGSGIKFVSGTGLYSASTNAWMFNVVGCNANGTASVGQVFGDGTVPAGYTSGYGIDIDDGDSEWMNGVLAHQNVNYGIRINDFGNYVNCYTERNLNDVGGSFTGGILEATAGNDNEIHSRKGAAWVDNGVHNSIYDSRWAVKISSGGNNNPISLVPSGGSWAPATAYVGGTVDLKGKHTAIYNGDANEAFNFVGMGNGAAYSVIRNLRDGVEIAQDTTSALVLAANFTFEVALVMLVNVTDGNVALYLADRNAPSTTELSDPGTVWTNTLHNAGTNNCCFDTANNLVIQNKLSGAKTYKAFVTII